MAGRHEDVSFRVFVDESEIGVYAATDLEFGSQMEHEGQKYQGMTKPVYDASYNGDRGSATLELPAEYDNFQEVFEAYKAGVINRTSSGVIRMVIGFKDPATGKRYTTRQDRCQLQFGQRSSSKGRITQQISWVAEEGTLIS